MNDTQLAAFVTSFLPSQFILSTARELGVLRRQSKFDLILFIWTLVFCSFSAATASVAHLQRQYIRLAQLPLSRSAFYKRFNMDMAKLCERLFEHLLAFGLNQKSHWIHHYLETFDGVLAIDSTTVALRKTLETVWQTCHKGSSALKLHAVYNVLDFKFDHIQLTAAKRHDIIGVKNISNFCRGKLILFDLAYYSHKVFSQIDHAKGFFVCRLKENAEPKIVRELVRGRGQPAKLAGMPLRMMLAQLERQTLDLWVELGSGKTKIECRLVGTRDQEDKWRLYVTNLGCEQFEACEVVELYRVRWQVELLFKQLKSQGHLDSLEGKTEATVKIQMYAILMGYAMCGELMNEVRRRIDERQASMTRGLEALRVLGGELVEMLYEGVTPGRGRRAWMDRFAQMSVDPNILRSRFLDPIIRTSKLSLTPCRGVA